MKCLFRISRPSHHPLGQPPTTTLSEQKREQFNIPISEMFPTVSDTPHHHFHDDSLKATSTYFPPHPPPPQASGKSSRIPALCHRILPLPVSTVVPAPLGAWARPCCREPWCTELVQGRRTASSNTLIFPSTLIHMAWIGLRMQMLSSLNWMVDSFSLFWFRICNNSKA